MYLILCLKKSPEGSPPHFGSLPSQQNLLFWLDDLIFLTCYLLLSSSSLPTLFLSPFLPQEAAKNIFSQTVKCAGEKERLRSQSCQDLLDCLCVRMYVFKNTPSDEMLEEPVKSFDTLGLTGV